MAKKELETFSVGDTVRSLVNTVAGDMRYEVIRTFKNVCWVQIAKGYGDIVMRGGVRVEDRPIYKGVKYSILAKVISEEERANL